MVRIILQTHNITLNVYYASSAAPWCAGAPDRAPYDSSAPVIDVTFVDDAAFFVVARSAHTLLEHLSLTIDVIVCVFMFFGLVVNCAKGKTEIILKLRGKNSAAAAASLSARGGLAGTGCGVPKREVAVKLSEGTLLHVGSVPSFKHLGSIVCDDAGLVPEAWHRAESAMAAFAKLAGTVFRSLGVNLRQQKIAVGQGLDLLTIVL